VSVSLGGADVIFKIDGGASNGAFSICETTAEPGRLIPPHLHDTEDEFSYVLEEQPLLEKHNLRLIGT
jgi:uncharacterized cupin superfamily protein